MADLVSGGYPQRSSIWAALGLLANETQSDIPARTNAEWFGGGWTNGAGIAAVGVCTTVAVPVDPGMVIKRVNWIAGTTAASTPTHSWAALYSGIATPALIGSQSADATTTAIAANTLVQQTLGSTYLVKPADCPNGYIYVGICVAGTTAPSAFGWSTPTAGQIPFTSSTTPAALMPVFSGTSGSSLTTTAPATLTLAAAAVTPLVVLT